jgi:hypothetical protein
MAMSVNELAITVITASVDSDEPWGYIDYALGWARSISRPGWGARKVITSWWAAQRAVEQAAWQAVVGEGLVSEAKALALRAAVWHT